MDYKEQLLQQVMANCMGLFSTTQIRQLSDILNVSLYRYDISIKEESKELPANVDDFNFDVFKRYILDKTIQGKSEGTINLYSYRLKQFITYIDKKVTDIQPDDIKFYLAYFKTIKKSSGTTLENTRLILSDFFRYLHDNEYITKNPMKQVAKIKKDTIKDAPFTIVEQELIRNACVNKRDRAIIEFLLATGCRVSEAVSVNRDQINYNTKKFKVIGKGNKERAIPINDKALLYVKDYLDSRTDNNPALFVTIRNPYRRISIDAVETLLHKLEDKSGITNIHPHRFRRTFCCVNIDRGVPIEQVSTIMGHSSIDCTIREYHNANDELINYNYSKANNI